MNPYQVTRDFEAALRGYCGSPYAVVVNSCTAAIHLAARWQHYNMGARTVIVPARTYPSVPMSILHAGHTVEFNDSWDGAGAYELTPIKVWDCARRFTSGMYVGGFQCVSFSSSKILGIEQGGAILHDHRDADNWFRRMRFDGRTEGIDMMDDSFDLIGHHCLMPPGIAAQLLLKLHHLPLENADLPAREYPDLRLHKAFK
jgi:dTDP-4-amino-4,6-dideoxygalactose transaminase